MNRLAFTEHERALARETFEPLPRHLRPRAIAAYPEVRILPMRASQEPPAPRLPEGTILSHRQVIAAMPTALAEGLSVEQVIARALARGAAS